MDNEWEKIWKKVVITCFSVLSQRSPRETEGSHEDLRMVLAREALILEPISRWIKLGFMSR
jgi:hypothetical protein